MFKFNILLWCDEKMSYLKDNGIAISNGIPQIPEEFLYKDIPSSITTFRHRKSVAKSDRKNTLVSFYMFEDALWPRLYKLDDEISILTEYSGIVGFDLSPCVTMLRPRQKLSILINAIHSCYCGIHGIKILPNYRAGDFGTIRTADFFPDNNRFIVGNLGCLRNGFKEYGYYQLNIILHKKTPDMLFIVGGISKKDAKSILIKYPIEIIAYPDQRNKSRNGRSAYLYQLSDTQLIKSIYPSLEEVS